MTDSHSGLESTSLNVLSRRTARSDTPWEWDSGTQALYLALRSLNVGHGDEVVTTPPSWIATINPIVECGATPVFVDIAQDLNIDADLIPDPLTLLLTSSRVSGEVTLNVTSYSAAGQIAYVRLWYLNNPRGRRYGGARLLK